MTILQTIRAWLTASTSSSASASVAASRPPEAQPPSADIRHTGPLVAEVRQCTDVQALLAALSCYDGYVREAALKRAARLRASALLPGVVARLNDWVPQVRRRAQGLVLDWLPALDADAAVRLLGAVEPLRRARRSDHSAWLRAFEEAFVAHVGGARIVAELASRETGVARACYRLAEEYALADTAARVRAALSNRTDIVLAGRAAAALAGLEPAERAALGRIALGSHFGIVRATALRTLLADAPADAAALAGGMLADPHAWTRLVASTYLERHGIASAPLYAERLAAPGASVRTLRACLAGLAETGNQDDAGSVKTMTAHPSPRVRIDAYVAWLRLVPADRDALTQRILADGARRVRRLALTMRRRHGAYVPMDAALALLREHGDVDLMLDYAGSDPWQLLVLIVGLVPASHGDPALRARLRRELADWSGGYARLNDAQRAQLRQPETRAALFALLGGDERRARRLAHELDAL